MPGRPGRPLSAYLALSAVTGVTVLAINFGTGVMVARLLGPSGRGDLAVLATLVQLAAWLSALGMTEGMLFQAAKHPDNSKRIFGTSIPVVAVLGTLGAIIGEAALPLVVNDQPSLQLGRWFVLTVYLNMAGTMFSALLSGAQDFATSSFIRSLQPALYLLCLAVQATVGRLTLAGVLGAGAVSSLVVVIVSAGRLWRLHGVGPPSSTVAKDAARYGVRVQGSLFGSLATARLDLMIMPTVVTAAAIGRYSVATNLAGILVSVVGAVGDVVLPAAARRGEREATLLIVKVLRLVTYGGLFVGLPLGLLAAVLVPLVYGETFSGAVTPLRILLPGVVLAMAAGVMDDGLRAHNRPLAASLGALTSLVVTVVGLVLTLRPLGINGAAITTTVAYATAFAVSLTLMHQYDDFSWRQGFSLPALFRDVRDAVAH